MWKCRQCGETRQQNFSTCRSCGAARRAFSSAGLRTRQLSPMVSPAACPKCHSPKIMPNLRILDHAQYDRQPEVEVYRRPDALVFKGVERQRLRARTCGNCGYTELYADNPQLLWDAFEEAQQHS